MSYSAKVLEDSISPAGVQLTTVEATFPRFILAEANTHRVFSRNSASSRAIPTERNIERVTLDPFVPETFNQRIKGMGVGDALEAEEAEKARHLWVRASQEMAIHAKLLNDIGIDKSRANRLLEPFMWHTAIITSTQWTNFFGLRCPPGDKIDINFPAQPEMQQIALLMRDAMRESIPRNLNHGEWHLPLVTDEERFHEPDAKRLCMISSRRCARVSYDRQHDEEPFDVSIDRAGQLSTSGHFSPFEHVARPLDISDVHYDQDKIMVPISEARNLYDTDGAWWPDGLDLAKAWCGNLRGWWQFRKQFAEEADHSMILDYEVM